MTTAARAAAHAEAVESLYAAFGRGDIPAVLDMLAEDVRWEEWADSFAQRAGLEGLAPRRGRDGVAGFFEVIGRWEIGEFAVLDVTASDTQAVAEVVIDVTLPNGGRYRDEELHLWSFDDDGKIRRMRHYVDTAKHIAASAGRDTTQP